jgi:hypothetical protein
VHGCGEAARKKARADWLKSHQPTAPPPPMKEVKRAYLQRQLEKKIEEKRSDRTKQKSQEGTAAKKK